MINKFKDYDSVKGYGTIAQLPKGGYVVKIMDATIHEGSYGQYVQLSCDIARGEFTDFYKQDWQNQTNEDRKWHCIHLLNIPNDDGSEKDGWTKRSFKTFTDALEDSNDGYHFDWDEKKFKGKLIGGLFNTKQYRGNDGQIHESTNLAAFCSVDMIEKGTFKLPKDKKVKDAPAAETVTSAPAAGSDPFNINSDDLTF